ncbi:hypothetical protein [Kitasatospora purpeofusca]|uniref:Uncharacterized protein n=1 Tax=Kitasatospora purpeofusca TaxID=67352 RepID=A0ABZ1UFM2_9ACTN|nr:hypothetical protein [Kitasatospora purpeofusca]
MTASRPLPASQSAKRLPAMCASGPGSRVSSRSSAPKYRACNALADAPTRFVVTMLCAPGKPMLELVPTEDLARRAHLRAPRSTG